MGMGMTGSGETAGRWGWVELICNDRGEGIKRELRMRNRGWMREGVRNGVERKDVDRTTIRGDDKVLEGWKFVGGRKGKFGNRGEWRNGRGMAERWREKSELVGKMRKRNFAGMAEEDFGRWKMRNSGRGNLCGGR